MRTELVVSEPSLRELVAGTRIEPLIGSAPFITRAFSGFIRACNSHEGKRGLLDQGAVVRVICYLIVLRRDFGDNVWSDDFTPPVLTDREIEGFWGAVKHYPKDWVICHAHLWTYLRLAWKRVTGRSLPGRRRPDAVSLTFHGDPCARAFAAGVARCLWCLEEQYGRLR